MNRHPGTAAMPDTVVERWAYAGIRNLAGVGHHAFVTDSGHGRTVHYSTVKASLAIGEIYRVMVSRAGGATAMHGEPRYGGDGRLDVATVAEWQAHHHAARISLAVVRLHRDPSRLDALHDALAPLRTIAASMRTPTDQAAFIAHLVTEITAEFTTPPSPPRPR